MKPGAIQRAVSGLVFTTDVEAAETIQQSLLRVSGMHAATVNASISGAIKDQSALAAAAFVIVDVSGEADPVERINALVELLPPSTPVIAIGDTNDIRLYRAVQSAGASEYFFRPLVSDLIAGTIDRLLSRTELVSGPRTGKIIHFIGVRGGCGATSIAIRTAQMLSEYPPRPVFLMDLNLRSSDMAMQLDLQPNGAVYESLDNADRIDDLFLNRTLTKVSANLALMSTLNPLNQPVRLAEDALLTLFGTLAARYRYMVTEMPNNGISGLSQLLRLGSTVVLVSDGRMSSARDVARWRALFSTMLDGYTLVHVLNKIGAPGALPIEQFSQLADGAPDIVIPFDEEFARYSVMGMAQQNSGGVVELSLEPLIAKISGISRSPKGASSSIFKRLFRK